MQSLAVAAVRQRDGQDRRRRRRGATTCSSAPRTSPASTSSASLPAPLPARHRSPPSSSARRRDRRPGAQAQALQGRQAGHGRRPGRPRVHLRPLPARRRRPTTHHGRRARAAQELALRATTPCPGARCARRSTSASSRPGETCARPDASTRAPGTAGAFVALDPRNGRCSRWAPTRPSTRRSSPSRSRRPRADRLFGDSAGSPLFNRAIGGVYPTGSTFKPITALAALSTGVITPHAVIDDPGCIKIGLDHEERCNAGKVPLRAGRPAQGAVEVLRRLLLHAGPRLERARRASRCRSGRAASASATRPASTCRASRRHGPRPRLARRARTRKERACAQAHSTSPCGYRRRHQPPVDGRATT